MLSSEWERCAAWIQAALDESPKTHTLTDVFAMVTRGEAQFWPFERSAMVSLIWDEPQAKTLHQWLVGGDMDDLMSHNDDAERWARTRGCTRMLVAGRRGWERVMRPFGFEFVGVVLAKELR